jgi:phosphoglycerol transferase
VGEYLTAIVTYSDFIEEQYVDPDSVTITFPEQKRNLIYIYLESMEITYADNAAGGAFKNNVISELTELAVANEDFSGEDDTLNGGNTLSGATWTIAGMFAQTAGLPLKIGISDNSMDSQSNFFPSITTLGDILEAEDYKNVLMIGSEATFAGRDHYFSSHGNYEIMDYTYAVDNSWIPENYYEFWGYEDEKLFENAKNELLELTSSDQLFNLTLLTADTHFEDGYVCELCDTVYGEKQYANVMHCSSTQVTEFVKWIQQQDFYANTTIVISGDHLTMDSDFCKDVEEDYERKV